MLYLVSYDYHKAASSAIPAFTEVLKELVTSDRIVAGVHIVQSEVCLTEFVNRLKACFGDCKQPIGELLVVQIDSDTNLNGYLIGRNWIAINQLRSSNAF
jgi:hypothetical protein